MAKLNQHKNIYKLSIFNSIDPRKYDWIEYEDGTVLGQKTECKGNNIFIQSFLQTDNWSTSMSVVYFDQRLGAVHSKKLVEICILMVVVLKR